MQIIKQNKQINKNQSLILYEQMTKSSLISYILPVRYQLFQVIGEHFASNVYSENGILLLLALDVRYYVGEAKARLHQ